MSLPLVVGLNYKSTPVDIREKFVFTKETLSDSLKSFTSTIETNEAVILSTCNRTEIYTQAIDAKVIMQWLAETQRVPLSTLCEHAYIYEKKDSIAHAFRVASSLDSMVLGESQILGQIKDAVRIAGKTGTLGPHLRRLFEQAFSVAKQVRTQTQVGSYPVSLGYAILHLAKNIFSDLSRCRVLLIGAGEIITVVAKYFQIHGISHFLLANRSFAPAEKIGLPLHKIFSLQEIPAYLQEADIVVSAIHHWTPVIGKGMMETALRHRKHRPVLMVDLGIPRNIESEIKGLEEVYLYAMDDLRGILEENHKKRQEAVKEAEEIIMQQADRFCREANILKVNKLIQGYLKKMHKMRDDVLKDACQAYAGGEPVEKVFHKMAHQLSNKLLHDSCLWLKEAAACQQWDFIEQVKSISYESESIK